MTTLTSSDAVDAPPAGDASLATAASVGSLHFHVFLGAHSLLIGLLPFYLPVWMWRNGIGLDGLALLIAVSGFVFAAALSVWHRLARQVSLPALVGISFGLELVFVVVSMSAGLLLTHDATRSVAWLLAALTGTAAGCYNAFFWTTQRVLFAASLKRNDAGKRYGNFQIYVAVLLKLGIVIGGLFLDIDALPGLLALSTAVCLGTAWWLMPRLPRTSLLPASLPDQGVVTTRGAATRWVFLADGVFLLLESHFWTLSLFLLFGEDFTRLGVLVVVLGIAFALLFWASKNFIDRIAVRQVYMVAVLLYGLSWWLRSAAGDWQHPASVGALLITVTFTTTFFRLGFNKRFFEHARTAGVVPYLMWKSRLSQRCLGIVFLGIAIALGIAPGNVMHSLSSVYLLAAFAALVYLAYEAPAVESA